MKTLIKLAVAVVLSVGAIAVTALPGSMTVGRSENKAGPRTLFLQNCARCHGSDGRANTRLGRKLEAADLRAPDGGSKSVAGITRAITNGRPGMPAFGKKLRPADINAIAAYVRLLGEN